MSSPASAPRISIDAMRPAIASMAARQIEHFRPRPPSLRAEKIGCLRSSCVVAREMSHFPNAICKARDKSLLPATAPTAWPASRAEAIESSSVATIKGSGLRCRIGRYRSCSAGPISSFRSCRQAVMRSARPRMPISPGDDVGRYVAGSAGFGPNVDVVFCSGDRMSPTVPLLVLATGAPASTQPKISNRL
jgi:hypothetical protein